MISTFGRIKNVSTGRILKTNILKTGYLAVCVSLGARGNNKCFRIHRCVAETFIDNPDNLPCINHKDCSKLNNHVENLEFCTYQYNSIHASQNDRLKIHHGEENDNAKLTDEAVIYIRENYIPKDREFGARALSRKFGVCHSVVLDVIHNLRWNHI